MEIIAVGLIAGIVELINRLRGKDYWVVITILAAGAVGGVLGGFGYFVPNIIEGIAFGFATSGFVTIAGAIKSAVVPSTATKRAK